MKDTDRSVVTKVTDTTVQEVNSQYNGMRRLTKTSTMLNSQEVKTESTFDAVKGNLTTVQYNMETISPNCCNPSGNSSWANHFHMG